MSISPDLAATLFLTAIEAQPKRDLARSLARAMAAAGSQEEWDSGTIEAVVEELAAVAPAIPSPGDPGNSDMWESLAELARRAPATERAERAEWLADWQARNPVERRDVVADTLREARTELDRLCQEYGQACEERDRLRAERDAWRDLAVARKKSLQAVVGAAQTTRH